MQTAHQARPPGGIPTTRRRPRSWTRTGTFVIITAAAMAFLLGFVVLVADFGYAYSERQRVQGLLDMAGMATLLTVTPLDDAAGLQSVQQILSANGVDTSILDNVDVTQEGQGINIQIDATMNINALVGNYFGMTQYPTAASSLTSAVIQLEQPMLSGFGMFACDTLTIRNSMWSYDSRDGPDEGPPNGIPTFTGCTQSIVGVPEENCGDNFLVGSNGDVIFAGGAKVWGSVVAGGRIYRGSGGVGEISKHARVAAAAPGGIVDVNVDGTPYYSYPFTPIDCAESTHFPKHLQDNDGDGGHTHLGDSCPSGSHCYDDRRSIETDDSVDTDSDTSFEVNVLGTTHHYILGNRTFGGNLTGSSTGSMTPAASTSSAVHTWSNESVLFQNSPTVSLMGSPSWGSRGEDKKGVAVWPFGVEQKKASDPTAYEAGGWIWNDTNAGTAYFRTGVAYFFHELKLAGSQTYEFVGDYNRDGPVIWFIHGNGRDEGTADLKGNSATLTYTGLCDGVSCGTADEIPALRIYATDRSFLDLAGNFELSVDIIAPGAQLDMKGTSGVLGRVLGDVVDMSGTTAFRFDESLLEGSTDQPFQARIARARIVE